MDKTLKVGYYRMAIWNRLSIHMRLKLCCQSEEGQQLEKFM